MENRDGTRLGQGCMNHPALLAHAREMVDRCVAAGYDGFFWDEPTVQDCYCTHCREKYRATLGGELRAAAHEQLEQFRLLSIAGYVATMSEYVKSQNAGLETATCVMPPIAPPGRSPPASPPWTPSAAIPTGCVSTSRPPGSARTPVRCWTCAGATANAR